MRSCEASREVSRPSRASPGPPRRAVDLGPSNGLSCQSHPSPTSGLLAGLRWDLRSASVAVPPAGHGCAWRQVGGCQERHRADHRPTARPIEQIVERACSPGRELLRTCVGHRYAEQVTAVTPRVLASCPSLDTGQGVPTFGEQWHRVTRWPRSRNRIDTGRGGPRWGGVGEGTRDGQGTREQKRGRWTAGEITAF
jgi:hypothetical protein